MREVELTSLDIAFVIGQAKLWVQVLLPFPFILQDMDQISPPPEVFIEDHKQILSFNELLF